MIMNDRGTVSRHYTLETRTMADINIDWDTAHAAPPDPYTARNHDRVPTVSRRGVRSSRVTRRGTAAVIGDAITNTWGHAVDMSNPRIAAAVAAVASAPRDAAGRVSAEYLDRVATMLTDIDLVGTESISWHAVYAGTGTHGKRSPDYGYRAAGIDGLDIAAAVAVSHTNYPNVHAAAVGAGYIAPTEYREIRHAVHGGPGVTRSRRSMSWPVRMSLSQPRPRAADIDRGLARVSHTYRDKRGRVRQVLEWITAPDSDGVTRLVAATGTAGRVWRGHRIVVRGAATRERTTTRRVTAAVPLPDRDAITATVTNLRVGDRVSYAVPHDAGAARLTIGRTAAGYSITYRRGTGDDAVTARRVTRTAPQAVAAVLRLARLAP
jgi:hypothetical protein